MSTHIQFCHQFIVRRIVGDIRLRNVAVLYTLPISVLTAIIAVGCVEPQLLLIGPGHSKSPEQKLVLWFLRETRTKEGPKSFKIFCLKAMSWKENMTLNALKLEQEVIFCYIFET